MPRATASCVPARGAVDGARWVDHRRLVPRDAHPGLLPARRAVHPEHDQVALPEQSRLSVLDRATTRRARPGGRATRCSARGSSATTPPAGAAARIVEVEAYGGPEDRASHARFGRTRPQRGHVRAAGRSPTCTLSTGCTTASTSCDRVGRCGRRGAHPRGRAARGHRPRCAPTAWPRPGADARRGPRPARRRHASRLAATPDHRLASGPGLVGAAFGIDTSLDRDGPVRRRRRRCGWRAMPCRRPARSWPRRGSASTTRVGTGPREPWRFAIAGHPSVSGPTPAG